MAQDSTQGVAVAAKSIHQKATSIRTTDPKVQKLLTQITIASRDFQTSSLDNARDSFFELSKPLLVYVNQFHAQRQCANGSDPLNSRHRAVMSPMFMH